MSNVIDDIGAWVARTRAPLDHIVASGETLVALARHVVGPEEAERLRLEIEALEHDATPSDIRAEHDATPSDIRAEHDATPSDIRAEHDATPSEKGNG